MPAIAEVSVDPLQHQGLVAQIAKRYMGRGLEFEDLLQEGNLGLLQACERFDPSLGNQFSTYAHYWIKSYLRRAIANQARPIRIPVHLQQAIYKGETPDSPNVPDGRRKCLAAVFAVFAAAPDHGSQSEFGLEDIVADHRLQPTPEDEADRSEKLARLLDLIPPRHATVIRMRFGLEPYRPTTLIEVGRKLGVTRERVRQLEAVAIAKLRELARGAAT